MDKTILVTVKVTVNGVTYQKDQELLTFQKAFNSALGVGLKKKLTDRFWAIQKEKRSKSILLNTIPPNVTHENFVEYASWVSLRARAPFAMSCCICGSTKPVEMHHIRHIRNTVYRDLEKRRFLQVMSLRNRKQRPRPVCIHCHITVI